MNSYSLCSSFMVSFYFLYSLSLSVCVYVCMCVFVHMFVCAGVHVYVFGGQKSVSRYSLGAITVLLLCFFREGFSLGSGA